MRNLTIVLLFVLLALLPLSPPTEARAVRPNIILILTDDLDAASVRLFPRLEEMRRYSAVFEQAFVTTSLCCPSRSSTLRGQYTHNHGVLGNDPPLGGFARFRSLGREESTIATWLQRAGYRTGLLGKYLNGYPAESGYVPPGWETWASPTPAQSYRLYGYWMAEGSVPRYYGHGEADYLTDVLSRKAVEFVSQPDARPFFLYLAPTAPHEPATPAQRHRDAFPGVTYPRGPSFDEADTSDKPGWVRDKPPLSVNQIGYIDSLYRKRLQSMLAVDEMVEAVFQALWQTGKLRDTYVVFTSDNGFHLGEHRLTPGKGSAYVEDIKVPLYVYGPGIAPGIRDEIALNIDLAPTFADWGRVQTPAFVDGRSLAPLLQPWWIQRGPWRDAFLVDRSTIKPTFQGVRTADSMYLEYATGAREYYDLRTDPWELDNLAGRAETGALVERLERLKDCAGAQCREADTSAPVKRGWPWEGWWPWR